MVKRQGAFFGAPPTATTGDYAQYPYFNEPSTNPTAPPQQPLATKGSTRRAKKMVAPSVVQGNNNNSSMPTAPPQVQSRASVSVTLAASPPSSSSLGAVSPVKAPRTAAQHRKHQQQQQYQQQAPATTSTTAATTTQDNDHNTHNAHNDDNDTDEDGFSSPAPFSGPSMLRTVIKNNTQSGMGMGFGNMSPLMAALMFQPSPQSPYPYYQPPPPPSSSSSPPSLPTDGYPPLAPLSPTTKNRKKKSMRTAKELRESAPRTGNAYVYHQRTHPTSKKKLAKMGKRTRTTEGVNDGTGGWASVSADEPDDAAAVDTVIKGNRPLVKRAGQEVWIERVGV